MSVVFLNLMLGRRSHGVGLGWAGSFSTGMQVSGGGDVGTKRYKGGKQDLGMLRVGGLDGVVELWRRKFFFFFGYEKERACWGLGCLGS